MRTSNITPIADIGRRVPEAGRIRLGRSEPNGRNKKPIKLRCFRFTSSQRDLIATLAEHYGGTVQPWEQQFEIISEVNQIPVILFADGLDQTYEQWSGGALQRRCDGLKCEMPEPDGDYDWKMAEHDCICARQGFRECAPKTRLSVIIPVLPFAGTWRVETSGFNAAEELPGMFEMITRINSSGGMVQALLGMEERTKVVVTGKGPQTRRFMVPKLGIAQTPVELAAGAATLGAISAHGEAAVVPALPSGVREGTVAAPAAEIATERPVQSEWSPYPDDDEIAEAEIVDDDGDPVMDELVAKLRADAEHFSLDADAYVEAIRSWAEDDADKIAKLIGEVRAERTVPTGFRNGRVTWQKKA